MRASGGCQPPGERCPAPYRPALPPRLFLLGLVEHPRGEADDVPIHRCGVPALPPQRPHSAAARPPGAGGPRAAPLPCEPSRWTWEQRLPGKAAVTSAAVLHRGGGGGGGHEGRGKTGAGGEWQNSPCAVGRRRRARPPLLSAAACAACRTQAPAIIMPLTSGGARRWLRSAHGPAIGSRLLLRCRHAAPAVGAATQRAAYMHLDAQRWRWVGHRPASALPPRHPPAHVCARPTHTVARSVALAAQQASCLSRQRSKTRSASPRPTLGTPSRTHAHDATNATQAVGGGPRLSPLAATLAGRPDR